MAQTKITNVDNDLEVEGSIKSLGNDVLDSSNHSYDNTLSGLASTNTKEAIDEVEARLETAETSITSLNADQHTHSNKTELDLITDAGSGEIITTVERTKLSGIEDNAKDDQNASEVPYDNTTSGLTATDTHAAGS